MRPVNGNVSVAMCTYNGEKYIQEQIESILGQTHKIDEIVICDDGSTDSTVAIAEKLLSASNIDYVIERNAKQLGVTKNFEKAISMCKSEFVFLCDQDDIWYPEKVGKMLNKFVSNDVVLVYSDAHVVDGEKRLKRVSLHRDICFLNETVMQTDIVETFTRFQYTVHGCLMAVRKSFVNDIVPFPETRMLHDSWISFSAGLLGKIEYVNEPLIQYRIHQNNATQGVVAQDGWSQEVAKLDCYDSRFNLHIYRKLRVQLMQQAMGKWYEKKKYTKIYTYHFLLAYYRAIKLYNRLVSAKNKGCLYRILILLLSFVDYSYFYRNQNRGAVNSLSHQIKLLAADVRFMYLNNW